jgi:hypothetical protein
VRPALRRWSLPVASLAIVAPASAQPSVSVNLGPPNAIQIPSLPTNPPDAVRTSLGATISEATGYTYTFNPIIRGTGLLGSILIPSDISLGDELNTFTPGMYRVVYGAVRNPPGPIPSPPPAPIQTRVYFEPVGGTFSGLTLSLTLSLEIHADRTAVAAIRNITKPSGVGLNVVSGAAVISTFTPPPPVHTEWHFDGSLLSVRETGQFPSSGPSRLRYLDDPAFGPILGGPGQLTDYPNPPTPTGVTQAQSAFGTTTSFGLPPIGGRTATVYRTSPTRNLADPTNRAKSRGLGLALWPNTRDTWPDDKLASWTLILDLYIPASSWAAEYPVALFDTNHNNDTAADAFIRQAGGQGSIGYVANPPSGLIPTPLLGPDRWMRLAISADSYRQGNSRIFIDGVLVGTSGAGWLYNSTKSTDPRYPNISDAQPVGTPVPPATWAAWGQFPSPWAHIPDPAAPNDSSKATPMGSTVCLFADLQGRGEAVYIANLFFADEAMTDTQIASLGGPDARGILYLPCPADADGNGLIEPADVATFVSLWFGSLTAGTLAGDFDGNGQVQPADVAAFVAAWFAAVAGGC